MVFTHNMGFWPQRYAAIVVVAVTLVLADSSLGTWGSRMATRVRAGPGPGEVVAGAARAAAGRGAVVSTCPDEGSRFKARPRFEAS